MKVHDDPYSAVVRFSRVRADDNPYYERGNDGLYNYRRLCPQQGSDNAGGGYATIKIELPANWDALMAELGYESLDSYQ